MKCHRGTDAAAKAKLEDRELQKQFQEVEQLPDDDKVVVKKLLDAFLAKKALAGFDTPSEKGNAMTKIQIELTDATAQAAQAAGLLTPQALERLLSNALRKQQAADYLLSVADEVAAAGVAPMSMEEITAEVKAVREERRQRADRH